MVGHRLDVLIPGWEGSPGPFPSQYGRPHVYARDVQSGSGNCVCGRAPEVRMHVPVPSTPVGTGTVADAVAQVSEDSNG